MKKARYAKIVATGHYVPEKTVTNAEMDQRYGQPLSAWIEPNIGIKERHFAAINETTSDLAVQAARRALAKANIRPEDLALLIVATDTPDYISPVTASVVQYKLGAKRAGVFDINNACAAFVSGLIIGSKFITTEPHYNNVLVVGAYGMSKFINWDDYKTATIFADGAGAAVLQAADSPGFLGSKMQADGSYHDYMGIYVGGAYKPPTADLIEKKEQYLVIAKRFPPDLNATQWPPLIRSVVDEVGHKVSEIDRVYFTQINLNTIKEVMKTLGLPLEKTHWIMDKWGYTGSACVAMALDDHIEQERGPKPGDLVVFCASGGGYAMAAAAFIW
ncbi:ketoacyl-ACP synthase III [Candidatus Acetothermia bacterium]|nr:ketoacyl-ACP synthase III [Candidatus Acetothermia bacterium]